MNKTFRVILMVVILNKTIAIATDETMSKLIF